MQLIFKLYFYLYATFAIVSITFLMLSGNLFNLDSLPYSSFLAITTFCYGFALYKGFRARWPTYLIALACITYSFPNSAFLETKLEHIYWLQLIFFATYAIFLILIYEKKSTSITPPNG